MALNKTIKNMMFKPWKSKTGGTICHKTKQRAYQHDPIRQPCRSNVRKNLASLMNDPVQKIKFSKININLMQIDT